MRSRSTPALPMAQGRTLRFADNVCAIYVRRRHVPHSALVPPHPHPNLHPRPPFACPLSLPRRHLLCHSSSMTSLRECTACTSLTACGLHTVSHTCLVSADNRVGGGCLEGGAS
jgi:hypothetical protein